MDDKDVVKFLNDLSFECYTQSKKSGWHDPEVDASFVERLCLIHSEVSEVLEEYRKPESDVTRVWYEKNGKPEGIPIEVADILIRVFDLCGKHNIDVGAAVVEKMKFNQTRPYRHGNKKV